jgi:hypothetical protein
MEDSSRWGIIPSIRVPDMPTAITFYPEDHVGNWLTFWNIPQQRRSVDHT